MIDYLIYTNEVGKGDVRDLAVQAFVVNEDPALTGHLLRAWCSLQEAEDDEPIAGFVCNTNAECDARYRFYATIYRKVVGYDCDEVCEPDWPENCFLPKWFVKQVAVIEGQKDKAGMRMMRQLHEEMDRDLHSLTKEQFKAKHGFVHGGYAELEASAQ